MLIDWFTVIAQVINFLILVWLLKRFLYQPVLKAIDERENRITARLSEAETQKAEAGKERGHFQQLSQELEQQRAGLLKKAAEEAAAEHQRLMEAAREDHRLLRARLQESLRAEQSNLSRDILHRIQREVFALARKVLADLADTTLESQMAAVFARQATELNEEERKKLAAALQASKQPVAIRSTFELPAEQQAAVERAVRPLLPAGKELIFETSPDGQVEGIELTTDGYKMAWTATDYLSTLEKKIAGILDEELEAEPKTAEHEP